MLVSKREKNYTKKVAEHLKKGMVVVFPTETVYGIGASLEREENIKRIIELKGREEKKPIAIMCASLEEAKKYFEFEKEEFAIANKFFPAPLTMLLKRKRTIPKWFYPEFKKIGLRIPKCETALEILQEFGDILAVTSANKSGREEAKSFEKALFYFGRYPDVLIVDGGKTKEGKPSTVIEIQKEGIKILREGKISLKELEEALNEK
ncbi:MAG: L-threonylcarbamoyladenylate synthase [Acidobacteriota bacterium]|nr:threonylcarbamoyl-AMP synthase [Thermoanaerobaculaceae bacterium]